MPPLTAPNGVPLRLRDRSLDARRRAALRYQLKDAKARIDKGGLRPAYLRRLATIIANCREALNKSAEGFDSSALGESS